MVAALAAGLVAVLTAGDAVAAQVAKIAIRGEVDGVTGTCSTRSMSRTLSRVELDATSGSPSRVTRRNTCPLGLSGAVKVTVEGQRRRSGRPGDDDGAVLCGGHGRIEPRCGRRAG